MLNIDGYANTMNFEDAFDELDVLQGRCTDLVDSLIHTPEAAASIDDNAFMSLNNTASAEFDPLSPSTTLVGSPVSTMHSPPNKVLEESETTRDSSFADHPNSPSYPQYNEDASVLYGQWLSPPNQPEYAATDLPESAGFMDVDAPQFTSSLISSIHGDPQFFSPNFSAYAYLFSVIAVPDTANTLADSGPEYGFDPQQLQHNIRAVDESFSPSSDARLFSSPVRSIHSPVDYDIPEEPVEARYSSPPVATTTHVLCGQRSLQPAYGTVTGSAELGILEANARWPASASIDPALICDGSRSPQDVFLYPFVLTHDPIPIVAPPHFVSAGSQTDLGGLEPPQPWHEAVVADVQGQGQALGTEASTLSPAPISLSAQPKPGRQAPVYICELCSKEFDRSYNRNQHVKAHHENIRPFKCEHPGCTHAAKKKHDLKRHVQSHTGVSPRSCKVGPLGKGRVQSRGIRKDKPRK